jgi:hypothetical protein
MEQPSRVGLPDASYAGSDPNRGSEPARLFSSLRPIRCRDRAGCCRSLLEHADPRPAPTSVPGESTASGRRSKPAHRLSLDDPPRIIDGATDRTRREWVNSRPAMGRKYAGVDSTSFGDATS